jgi:streptogramin lyase
MSRIGSVVAAVLAFPVLSSAQLQFTVYNVQNAPSGYAMIPQRITIGADGNLWYTEYQPNNPEERIGRITPAGVMTEFRATLGPSGWVGPRMGFGIASLGGRLWYLEANQNKTGSMDPLNPYPSGPFDEFVSHQHPYTGMDMIAGPDGKLWYTQYNYLGRMNSAGITDGAWQVGSGFNGQPIRICVGPDGNLWVTVWYVGVVRMTPSGVLVATYQTGTPGTQRGIAAGPDGRVWFSNDGTIWAITTDGSVAQYPTEPVQNTRTQFVTAGPDGNLWATGNDNGGNGLVRMNTAGAFTMFNFPNPSTSANDVITGPDGCLWVAGGAGNQGQIIRACLPGPRAASVNSSRPDGVYVLGDTIDLTVEFTGPVLVTGSPRLALNSGGSAVYVSGSGTNVLTFSYTVQAGETTSRLDAGTAVPNLLSNLPEQTLSVRLNGGKIRDAAGNDAILLLPVYPTAGSLGSNKRIAINPPDSTPPVSEASAVPAPNAGGWNNGDVTVTINAADGAGSGVKQIHYALSGSHTGVQTVAGNTVTLVISAEGATTIDYYATDIIGNVETARSLTIRLDKTPPTVEFGSASPPANAAGWNNTSVSIPFTVVDPLSGTDPGGTPVSPLVLSAEGSSVTGTIAVSDLAGNSTTVTSPPFRIDRTPPAIAGLRTPLPNPNGWNNTDVAVTFSCTEGGSGLAPGSPPPATALSSDGAGQSVTGACQDLAGNTASVTVTAINIDKTPPAITPNPAPGPDWHNSPLTVSFSAADALSGVEGCTGPVSLTADGAGQTASATCADRAGNDVSMTAGPYNIDTMRPVVSQVRADPSVVPVNTGFTLIAAASDSASGVESMLYSIDGGADSSLTSSAGAWSTPVPPLSVGVHSVCVRATDRAANPSDLLCALVPVYDPAGGFVTGGGWITSPLGAYAADPSLSGRATLGFSSKYQNGAGAPSGETHFLFQMANLSFKSNVYEWLVVAGARAQFKGSGTINGAGDYGFLLTAVDGDVNGGGGLDRFRIKIWSKNPDGGAAGIIYDNQMGADDGGDSATVIGGGAIVIHK